MPARAQPQVSFENADDRLPLPFRRGTADHRTALGSGKGFFENGESKKKTSRGREQDRARVSGGQSYEVKYETKKTGRSSAAVKKAVKKVGNSRKRMERRLGR